MLPAPQAKPGSRRPAPAFEPLDLRLLARPLDFIAAEHYRLRAAMTQLDWLARGSMGDGRRKLAKALLRYFTEDYPLHLADEEADFFPLLRQRCGDDAAFLASLETLGEEHHDDVTRLAAVVDSLRRFAEAGQRVEIPADFAAGARAYTEALRRHIAWENAVLMPVARARLQSADLRRLAQRFGARRGVSPPSRARAGDKVTR
jgi:hemerythrin-like domain-containing protein